VVPVHASARVRAPTLPEKVDPFGGYSNIERPKSAPARARRATVPQRRLVGIHLDEHLHEHTHLRFGRTSAIAWCEGHSDFGPCSHTSFESLRAGHRRDASREQANPKEGRQEVAERSLYNRRPRSLAALEATKLLTR
jgi:hypothetical protein